MRMPVAERVRRTIPGVGAGALELLYPQRCVACGRFGLALCGGCEASLPPATGEGRCPHCRAPWDEPGNCPRCFAMQSIDGLVAASEMAGPARAVVHGLKYRGIRSLATVMARQLAPLRENHPFDVAMPVPLHRSRVRARGFNQAELMLRELGWQAPEAKLHRRRKTKTQVGLEFTDRRGNVRGAFMCEGPALTELRVALVDDVVTTGATVEECARVLRDHGAATVVVFAFARAGYRPDATVVLDA